MVMLAREDIRTEEVLALKGFHLFHFQLSSCSQKVRIFLNLKNIPWESHPIDLTRNENLTEYFLGINPRGLVPALVHDGDVHIESNDILLYLESLYPDPPLLPSGRNLLVQELLDVEDGLHMDLRTLTFTFLPQPPEVKSAETLQNYVSFGSGTVGGQPDNRKANEIAFWNRFRDGRIGADEVQLSARRFRQRLAEVERLLGSKPYLLGELSVLDIAWFVYVERLLMVGYPLGRVHPGLAEWHSRLANIEEFAGETAFPSELENIVSAHVSSLETRGLGLAHIAAHELK